MHCRILMLVILVLIILKFVFGTNLTIIDTTKTGFNSCGDFICRVPKKEVFKLEDLVDTNNEGSVLQASEKIVLQRCRKNTGGCCPNNQVCTASENEKEYKCIKFKFQFISFDDSVEKYIVVENHLSCSCQIREISIKEHGLPIKDKCEL